MLDENEIIFCRLRRRRRVLYVAAAAANAGVRESFCGRARSTDCEQLRLFSVLLLCE